MGAIMFFLMFIALIPVANAVMRILDALGLMGDMTDPPEWDMEETEYEQTDF